jgi:hypothetical protein
MGLRTVYLQLLGLWERVSGDVEINSNLVMYLDDPVHLLALSEYLQL